MDVRASGMSSLLQHPRLTHERLLATISAFTEMLLTQLKKVSTLILCSLNWLDGGGGLAAVSGSSRKSGALISHRLITGIFWYVWTSNGSLIWSFVPALKRPIDELFGLM